MFSKPAWDLDTLLKFTPEAVALARRVMTDDDAENSPVIWLASPFERLALRKQPVNKPKTAILYVTGFSETEIHDLENVSAADEFLRSMLPEAYHDTCYDQLNLPKLQDITVFTAPVNIDSIGAWCPYQFALYDYAKEHGLRYSVLKEKFLVPTNRRQVRVSREA